MNLFGMIIFYTDTYCDTRVEERLVIIVQPSSHRASRASHSAATFTPFERPGIPESLRNYKW